MEIWKNIEFFEGKYSISNLAYIKNNETGRILKTRVSKDGYRTITITYKRKIYSFEVHSLLMKAFKPKGDSNVKLIIDHIDRNRLNNNLDNLRWVTYLENSKNRSKRKSIPSFKTYLKLRKIYQEERLEKILNNLL